MNDRFISGKEWKYISGMTSIEMAMCSCFSGITPYDKDNERSTPVAFEYLWEWCILELFSQRMNKKLVSFSSELHNVLSQIKNSDIYEHVKKEKSDSIYCKRLAKTLDLCYFIRNQVDDFEYNGGFAVMIKNVIANNEISKLMTDQLEHWKNLMNEENNEKQTTQKNELTTRARQTHLLIIAALCKRAGLDWNERGLARKISSTLDEMKISMDDDTIRKILHEIPDAIDVRQK